MISYLRRMSPTAKVLEHTSPPTTSSSDSPVERLRAERNERRKALIVQTWKLVEESLNVKAIAKFYEKLSEEYPETAPMFEGLTTDLQARKLYEVIQVAVRFVNELDTLVPYLKDLGIRHRNYGVLDAHYDAVTKVFLQVLREHIQMNGLLWMDVADAWGWILNFLGKTMADAANDRPSPTTIC